MKSSANKSPFKCTIYYPGTRGLCKAAAVQDFTHELGPCARHAIENKHNPHSQVLQPGASSNTPDPH
eukprot:1148443-Pelagomonas_calceolata.AAC.3